MGTTTTILTPLQSVYVMHNVYNNYNADDFLRAGTGGVTIGSSTFLQFDLSGMASYSNISAASLKLFSYHKEGYDYADSCPLTIRQLLSSWDASTLNWGNLPGQRNNFEVSAAHSGYDVWYDYDITNMVKDWFYTGTINYGMRIYQPSYVTSTMKTFKRTGIYAPQLVLTHDDTIVKVGEDTVKHIYVNGDKLTKLVLS